MNQQDCSRQMAIFMCHYANLTHCPSGNAAVIFKSTIFQPMVRSSNLGTWCEIAVLWMPQNLTNEKSSLIQVMARCHQTTDPYLKQCWPRSPTPYHVITPQWDKCITLYNVNRSLPLCGWLMISQHGPVSQIRAPPGGLLRTSGKLWQDYSNCYMFWT